MNITVVSLFIAIFAGMCVQNCNTIEWLALSRSRYKWNNKKQCYLANKKHLIHEKQMKFCDSKLDAMPFGVQAAKAAIEICQKQFANSRWNCSTIARTPYYYADLRTGTREQAYVYALASASLAYTWAKACSAGNLQSCGCGPNPRQNPKRGFKWGGCGDNVNAAVKFARDFTDAPYKGRGSKRDAFALMNKHNYKAGRQAVRNDGLRKYCKCHGVSGACNVKTCWKGLAKLPEITDRLKRRYESAIEVQEPQRLQRKRNLAGREDRNMLLIENKNHLKKVDLVYVTKSSDYCSYDERLGSLGTRSRRCNSTSTGSDSCSVMCCGRGFHRMSDIEVKDCFCKLNCFNGSCDVVCKRCKNFIRVDVCN